MQHHYHTVLSHGALTYSSLTVYSDVCLQDLYQLPKTPAFDKKNILGVTGYGDEWAQISDLKVRSQSLHVRAVTAVPH
jgi:hypothetical protein